MWTYGEGTLTVVAQQSADRYQVLAQLPTQKSARTMALDPVTGQLYLAAASFGPLPAATPEKPRPRAPMLPNSFSILKVSP